MAKQKNTIKLSKKSTKKDDKPKKIKQKNTIKYGKGKTVLKITKRRVIKKKKV
jgi:hypothetical protein